MKKTYVIDTSVFAFDPNCLQKLDNAEIILPIQVIEELDKLKKFPGEVGKNARLAIRQLDALSEQGEIHVGIKLEDTNSTIKVETETFEGIGEDPLYNDNKILGCAANINRQDVCLLTRDINLRIRARALGLDSEDYSKKSKQSDEFYSGIQFVADDEMIQEIMETGEINLKGKDLQVDPNQFIGLVDDLGHDVALGRRVGLSDKVKTVKKLEAWGIQPRNLEQQAALDLLFDPNIPLVSLMGRAGSGKTLMSMAAAFEMVLNRKKYNKLLVYRPIQPFKKDIGYVPGTKDEKMMVWMGAICDAAETLLTPEGSKSNRKSKNWQDELHMFMEKDLISFEALTYIRGRSLNNCLILIDEIQNLASEDLKTILSRVGVGSKIIATGDVEQIDDSSLDAGNNAMSTLIETFRESRLAGHITFRECLRSELADEAIRLLS